MLFRVGGTGATHLGIKRGAAHDRVTATLWLTVLYMPVFPLGREELWLMPHDGSGYRAQALRRLPLSWGEVLKTYIFGWLVFPVLLGWPGVLAIVEVWESLGLPQSLHIYWFGLTIFWLAAGGMVLSYWDERRRRPHGPA